MPMPIIEQENKIGSPQEEIAKLKKRISELEVSPDSLEGVANKEMVGQVVKEHIETPPEKVLSEEYKFSPEKIEKHTEVIAGIQKGEEKCQEQIAKLLQLVQDEGILNAVAVAKKLNNPHLQDDFHGALIKFFQGIH
jgi:chromosome segregation ATPase